MHSSAWSDGTNGAMNPPEVDDTSYDTLTELFLGEFGEDAATPEQRTTPQRPTDQSFVPPTEPVSAIASGVVACGGAVPTRPTIEALVLGHLPVIAGPWAAQYASREAEQSQRPVALLRLGAGQLSVEIFSPRGDEPGDATATDDLRFALREAARCADRWILRVESIDEPSLAVRPDIESVTLLCGADEAAIVSSYRTIKSLAADENGLAGADSVPSIRIAIMGAGGEKAERAGTKLRRAADAFLGRPLVIAPPLERMAPAPSHRLYQANVELDAAGLLLEAERALRQEAAPLRIAGHETHPSPNTMDAPATHEHAGATAPNRRNTAPSTAADSPDVLLHAAPALHTRPGAAFSAHIAGLHPLPARCPYDEAVELALDDAGILHLLTGARPEALSAFAVVEEWAMTHASLLALTDTHARGMNTKTPARRHLFTDSPKAVRRLLDTDVQVHLLVNAAVEGRHVLVSAELN